MKTVLPAICMAAMFGVVAGVSAQSGSTAKDKMVKTSGTMDPTWYEVTIENVTAGQPLSPGLIVTHGAGLHLFEKGKKASAGVIKIAEDGMQMTAVEALKGMSGIHQVVDTAKPIVPNGTPGMPNTMTFRISANGGDARLSLAMMLSCTNDGFAGVDSIELPRDGQAKTIDAMAYDAGTETNNEMFDSIVDGCHLEGPVKAPADGNKRAPAAGHIGEHAGITGDSDLKRDKHGWQGPVARVTIRQVRKDDDSRK